MPKGKMTLEKLAAMVQQGFQSVEKRLDRLEARMDRLEARMDRLEADMAQMRRQLNKAVYQPEFEVLESRIVRLEHKVGIKA